MPAVGLFGAPGSGKSTVFKALTRQSAAQQFATLDLKPHQAMVKIPDPRLDKLVELVQPRSIVHAAFEFVDIPGFDPSAERKLKTAILEHYRRVDALALVANLFDPQAASPTAQVRNLLEELTLLDLVTVERAHERLEKTSRLKGSAEDKLKLSAMAKLKATLEEGTPARRVELEDEETRSIRELGLLSAKPIICVLNLADDDFKKPVAEVPGLTEVIRLAESEGLQPLPFAASLESALADMTDEEAEEYMAEFGVSEPSLPRFIRAAFGTLGLITFFTAGEQEARSWPLRTASTAQQAAGTIHSDLARGFIRAETVAYDDFVSTGGWTGAKGAGKVRLEGKQYVVQDGDVLLIRFNV
jgi:GTP-binding protein YchF